MAVWSKLAAFSLGLTTGATLAILAAPQAGEDSRAYISEAVRRGVDRAKETGSKLSKRAREAAAQVSEKLREYIERSQESGEESYSEAKNRLS